jgi:sorbitol/mannitol transport system permease protein
MSTSRRSVQGSLVTLGTWLLVLVFFFPVFWMVLNGFKPESVASSVNPKLFFTPVTEGYQLAMDRGMAGYLQNSLTASIISTIIAVTLAIPAAYALSIRQVKNPQNSLSFFISTRFMPLAAIVLPLFMILKTFDLLDNIYMLAIVYGAMNLPVTVWMMRSFFLEVPYEIIEAARVDGAGLGREIIRIVLPLVLPGIAAAALISFIFAWNEYFLALLLTSSAARTTPPFLGSFVDGRGQFLAVLSAAATIAALPVIVAGWVAQKQLVRGLSMGAIK